MFQKSRASSGFWACDGSGGEPTSECDVIREESGVQLCDCIQMGGSATVLHASRLAFQDLAAENPAIEWNFKSYSKGPLFGDVITFSGACPGFVKCSKKPPGKNSSQVH